MGNQHVDSTNFERITVKYCVVVHTCDAYQKFWHGFYNSMQKYWDFEIDCPIFFCNENINTTFSNPKFKQLKTGSGSHSQRLSFILDNLQEYDYIFYMLEDFWPTNPMTKQMFEGLAEITIQNNWDSLRLSHFLPEYYKAEPTQIEFQNQKILKFRKDSKWQFSQQAAFWNRKFLKSCIVEPEISETQISTSLSGEIAMDQYLIKNHPDAKIYHYHYHWYPVSGTVWRGELTQIGQEIEYILYLDEFVKKM